jgi:ribonuclease PH
VTDLQLLGERQIKIDCDVLQADGGTRTASITGSWVALRAATEKLLLDGQITRQPVTGQVAAISCGIFEKSVVLDLDYAEDSQAETDANFVLTADSGIVEVQATAEADPYKTDDLLTMLDLAKKGTNILFQHQQKALDTYI